jgi:MFS family permease
VTLSASPFRSLRHRDYRVYFWGSLVSLVGGWMQNAAQAWLVYDLTGSKVWLGVVSMLSTLPILLVSLWGGALADRVPRRRILLATQSASAVLALALAVIVGAGVVQVAHILALAFALGVVLGYDMPARQAFVVDLVGREDLSNAIALNAAVFHGARVVGPAVAGVLIAWIGPTPCFAINGLSFGAVIVALLALRLEGISKQSRPARDGEGILSGFGLVRRTPGLTALMGLALVMGIFGWSYTVLMPAFARDVLGVGPAGYGWLMAVNGLGSVLGSLLVAWIPQGRAMRWLNVWSIALFSAATFGFASVTSFPVALAFLGVSGVGLSAFFSSNNTLIQISVEDAVRGRVMGVYTAVFGAMLPLGALEAGAMAEWIGPQDTVRLGVAVCLAAVVFGARALREPNARQG